MPGVQCPEEPAWARSNWQSFCVRLPARVDQRRVMQFMLDKGIATRRGIMCAHREPAYQVLSRADRTNEPAPQGATRKLSAPEESERAQDQCILVPLFPQMTDDELEHAVLVLREALA
jgi:dTDP-4-amino-4,6-dideoxygalactose transaminase